MRNFFLLALLVLPAIILTLDNGFSFLAKAEDQAYDNDVEVDSEETGPVRVEEAPTIEEATPSTGSPFADTKLLFVRPTATASQLELPAGVPVEFLVGFRNKGENEFVLELLEASFRYPMDFNFYIQNFSAIGYNKVVRANEEATLAYSFVPSESFAGRPFGLNINLAYRDGEGNSFQEAVFNETIQIVELEQGLDGETFFLYVFLVAGVVLLLVIGQQTLLSFGKKRVTRKAAPVETGTDNPNNVDYDWLPKQTLASINKSQKSPKSVKQSPRQRKTKRNTGSSE